MTPFKTVYMVKKSIKESTHMPMPMPTPTSTFECSETSDESHAQFARAADALQFILGGNATVTLVSKKTGTRFTYKIARSDDESTYFIGLLRGADNGSDYSYLGRITANLQQLWLGRKTPRADDITPSAPSARAFAYAFDHLKVGTIPPQLEIWHEGKCGRCGRKLTVPSSIASGFGPECINHV